MIDLVRDCTVPPLGTCLGTWLWGTFARATLELVAGPEIEPVTLAEMKRSIRAFSDVTDDDAEISALITGARQWVEDYTARACIDQLLRQTIEGDFGPAIRLHRSPVLAIDSVIEVAADGSETTIDPARYELREADGKYPKLWMVDGTRWWRMSMQVPVVPSVRVTFRAGYADRTGSPVEGAEVVPVQLTQAMKLWTQAQYDRDPASMKTLLECAEYVAKPLCADLSFA